MEKQFDVVKSKQNSKGEYLKNKNGKGIYTNHGAILKDANGYMKLALETIHGTVWFDLFEPRTNSEEPPM